jgi:hypothetical protein
MGLNNPGGIKGAKISLCVIINGDFETGDLSGWDGHCFAIHDTNCYEGSYCAIGVCFTL